jgi:4-hydroxy-tetrahydrodipicolinate reductase
MSAPVRVALVGHGRMGAAVDALAASRGAVVVARLGRGTTIDGRALQGADVAVEFTEPGSAVDNALACLAAGCPVVVGTTGWLDRLPEVERATAAHAGRVLWAANFALGVNLFLRLAAEAGRLFADRGFDVGIVETHHAAKKDAPSGTAIALARAVGPALRRDVPIASARVGHVPGTHELTLDARFEQVRLTHEARDRRVFADGALVAACWLAAVRRPGVYTMQDVLAPSAPEVVA